MVAFLLGCFDPSERDFNPVLASVRIEPATGVLGDTLECIAEAADRDGDDPVVNFAWTNASTGLALGSGATYTITRPQAEAGNLLQCNVSASDADRGLAVTGLATAEVLNSPPSLAVEVTPAEGRVGDRFECRADAADPDGDTPTVAYAWSVAGTEVGTD
ncbi:MAG: hypothetical protein FJ102_27415, partial [Deltaproteobacteria bacterium]|nr:hypothetical protein [Deltaproteobacteria bacterium]